MELWSGAAVGDLTTAVIEQAADALVKCMLDLNMQVSNCGGNPLSEWDPMHVVRLIFKGPLSSNETRCFMVYPKTNSSKHPTTPSSLGMKLPSVANGTASKFSPGKWRTLSSNVAFGSPPNRNSKNEFSSITPLCKRSGEVIPTMMAPYQGADTLIPGFRLKAGQSLYSRTGARLYIEKDRHICLYYRWCLNPPVDFTGQNFCICSDMYLASGGNVKCYTINDDELPDYNSRLIIQTDYNVVVNRGVGFNSMVSTRGPNIFFTNYGHP